MRAAPWPVPLASVPLLFAACAGSARPSTCGDEAPAACRVESLEVRGAVRTYVVSGRHAPACDGSGRGLVLFFHGQGSNGGDARADFAAFEEALGERALVVYPDGLARSELGGNAGWDLDPAGDDTAFVDALLTRLVRDECVDASRVFGVGHSRGGRFVEVLACFHSGRFKGFAESSAGTGNVSRCPERAPMWIAHASDDTTIPFAEGEATRDLWAARNGCDAPTGSFTPGACTFLAGCDVPVVWCPYSGAAWGGHFPPPFLGTGVRAFFEAL